MAAYRAGELTLDQLMAFTVTEDHERQEQVFAALSYNRSPGHIRRLLTEEEVEASDRRAVFVGAEAYEAAGGRIRRDLFAEDRGGWFEDVGLLERLATETLQTDAERVRTEEGWRWAEAHLDYPQGHGLRRVYPTTPVRTRPTRRASPASAERVRRPRSRASRTASRPTEVDGAASRRSTRSWRPRPRRSLTRTTRARAGVFVVLDWEGQLRIERGFVRPEDEPRDPAAASAEARARSTRRRRQAAASEPTPGPKPLSDRLIADLTAHRTAALRDALANRPDTAFLAALHALVLQTFYHRPTQTCLELSATQSDLAGHAEAYADSAAGAAIEARHAAWACTPAEDRRGRCGTPLVSFSDGGAHEPLRPLRLAERQRRAAASAVARRALAPCRPSWRSTSAST